MKATVVIRPEAAHQVENGTLMANGLARHGINVFLCDPSQINLDCDFLVCWGWAIGQEIAKQDKNVLIMERGFVGNRREWTSCGWNGLNGRAVFCNEFSPSDRWDSYFANMMEPWRSGGDYVLVMGQVLGDQSLIGVDIQAWYSEAVNQTKAKWPYPVMFRPHPMDMSGYKPQGVEVGDGDLAVVLSHAALVVTFNSNSGVDAALSGAATVAMDEGSMAWPVASHDYEACLYPDRQQWVNDLAYAQWSQVEMASGLAWEHLKTYVERVVH